MTDKSAMAKSWQVRLAALLVSLDVVLGVAMIMMALRLVDNDPGFLFAILPILVTGLAVFGLFIAIAALTLAVQLWAGHPRARLQTLLFGGALAMVGVFLMTSQPGVGLLVSMKGFALVALMLTEGAKRDLGDWRASIAQPAPWGSTPGTSVWSDEPAQQGPWSPNPTTVPWVGWKGHSGPRPPWWQTWQHALEKGVPLWELVLLGVAVTGSLTGIVLNFIALTRGGLEPGPIVVISLSLALIWWLEHRMRVRLATGR